MLMQFLLVGLGGAVGSMTRYGLTLATRDLMPTFPYGTLLSNILGSLCIGIITEFAGVRASLSPDMRLLLATGFCGGFTTLSSLLYEFNSYLRSHDLLIAFGYLSLSLIAPFLCLLLGCFAVRAIFKY